jgi:hypothetical protein
MATVNNPIIQCKMVKKLRDSPPQLCLFGYQKVTDIVAVVDKLDAPDKIFVNLSLAKSIEEAEGMFQ